MINSIDGRGDQVGILMGIQYSMCSFRREPATRFPLDGRGLFAAVSVCSRSSRAFPSACVIRRSASGLSVSGRQAWRRPSGRGRGFRLGAHREASACVAGGPVVADDGKNVNEMDMNICADEYVSSLRLSAHVPVKRDGSFGPRRRSLTAPPGPR